MRSARAASGGEQPRRAAALGAPDEVVEDRDVVVNAARCEPHASSQSPTAVCVETDSSKAQLPPEACWDVPVVEVSIRQSTRPAREQHVHDQRAQQRHHR